MSTRKIIDSNSQWAQSLCNISKNIFVRQLFKDGLIDGKTKDDLTKNYVIVFSIKGTFSNLWDKLTNKKFDTEDSFFINCMKVDDDAHQEED